MAEVATAAAAPSDLERAAQLLAEGKQLIDDDPEGAVARLQEAVQLREKQGLANVPEAAPYYLAYGHALLAAERCSSDVFGSKVDQVPGARKEMEKAMGSGKAVAAQEKVVGKEATRTGGSDGGSAENQDPNAQPVIGEGKTQAAKPDNKSDQAGAQAKENTQAGVETKVEEQEEDGEEQEDGEEDGDDAEDAAEDGEGEVQEDKSLAWEMFEMARSLFLEGDASEHLLELGDLHSALSDLHAENAAFDLAEEELLIALKYVTQLKDRSLRSEAEIHFKMTMILHYKEDIEGAIEHSTAALDKFLEARQQLEASLEGLDEKIKAGDTEAAAALAKGEKELEMFDDCLVAIRDRKEDMEMVFKENARIKQEISDMFKSAMAGAPAGSREAKVAAEAAAVAAAGGSAVGGVPGARLLAELQDGAVAGAAAGLLGGAGPSRSTAPAQDLGKVGRGKGRITLQPVAATSNGSQQQPQPATGAASNGAMAGSAPKRTLEDVMGAAAPAQPSAAGQAGKEAKEAGTVLGEEQEVAAKKQKMDMEQVEA